MATDAEAWDCASAAWDRAWELYVYPSIEKHVGADAKNILVGAVAGAAGGLAAIFIGQTAGAAAGAAIGAYFSAGNPAVAVAAGQLGATIGRTITVGALQILGVYFLAEYVLDHIGQVGEYALAAFDLAVNQAPYLGGAIYDLVIDLAARLMGEAIGVLYSLVLSAVVAYVTIRLSMTNKSSAAYAELLESKLESWSTGFVKWLVPRLSSLRQAAIRAGGGPKFKLIEGGLPSSSVSPMQIAVRTARSLLPRILGAGGNRLALKSLKALDQTLTGEGFQLSKVEDWGPPGGKQLFYQKGNVLVRFKTMGDKAGPRTGQPHLSAAFNDGRGFDWQNDLGKFTFEGKVVAKVITDPAKFKPEADFQGNPHKFVMLPTHFEMPAVDAWANSTHFNAPAGFDLTGLDAIAARAK